MPKTLSKWSGYRGYRSMRENVLFCLPSDADEWGDWKHAMPQQSWLLYLRQHVRMCEELATDEQSDKNAEAKKDSLS